MSKAPTPYKIWIDLDNTPHVPFFEPIVEQLQKRGFDVVLTARDAFQVCELADASGMAYTKIGSHHGRNKLVKAAGLFWRAMQLAPFVLRQKPDLAVSHGARAQMIACGVMHVPTVLIDDYEFSAYPRGMRPDWQVVPSVISASALSCRPDRVRKYPGIKEDVYVGRLAPDANILRTLGITDGQLVITVRPPATEAHYHNQDGEKLFARFMDRACAHESSRIIMLPRNQRQARMLRARSPHWFSNGRTTVPEKAVDALNLVWHSDLVVSGGGTMNREAAALGVPVYSLFRGPIGAVDKELAAQGRLTLIQAIEQVDQIPLSKRERPASPHSHTRAALPAIVDHITEIAMDCTSSRSTLVIR